eukprot:TRINITY_DN5009_c1_g1_i1.p1 TRINITY_DN5009_c1_g1~~TRINITY_DN5009_c1_g1_i1.p1  ORF type:complete len:443 (+),score=75.40 TRINITY_DN5009_c1_g1_i1:72-1400(+)
MPLRPKVSGEKRRRSTTKEKKKKKKDKKAKKDLKFDFGLEERSNSSEDTRSVSEEREKKTLVVRSTLHGDLCEFDSESILRRGSHLASGDDLTHSLTAMLDFLEQEDCLHNRSKFKLKKSSQATTITLSSAKPKQFFTKLKYQISVLLPVALARHQGLSTPKPMQPKAHPPSSTDNFEQLKKELDDLTTQRLREVSHLQEEKFILQEQARQQKMDLLGYKSLESERDQLKSELHEQIRTNRISAKEVTVLREENAQLLNEKIQELEELKHQKESLENDVQEKRREQAKQMNAISSQLTQQMSTLGEMMQHAASSAQLLSPAAGGAYGVVHYVLDGKKYPRGARLRSEPEDDSKFLTEKSTGQFVTIEPHQITAFCNSRHNGFSKIRSPAGTTGYIRSKYLIPVPITPQAALTPLVPATPEGLQTPLAPTLSQPVFSETPESA